VTPIWHVPPRPSDVTSGDADSSAQKRNKKPGEVGLFIPLTTESNKVSLTDL